MWAIGKAQARPIEVDRGAQGFTLIEALVVMAVSALVAGIMFPGIQRSMSFWEYRSAITAVGGALQRGRAHALARDTATRFAVAPGGDSFNLSGEQPILLPASVRVSIPDRRPIDFFADGSASGGAVAVIAGARREIFVISPDTGLIGRRS